MSAKKKIKITLRAGYVCPEKRRKTEAKAELDHGYPWQYDETYFIELNVKRCPLCRKPHTFHMDFDEWKTGSFPV